MFSDRAKMLIPPMLWDRPRRQPGEGGKVVLLHGLWRSWRAMEPLSKRLAEEGFSTLNLPYPSARKPLDRIAAIIRSEISGFAEGQPVHLVTHSLGGIIARLLLADNPPWQPGRLVMMAPPSTGSEIIDWASGKALLRPLLCPAARALASDGVPSHLPELPPELEAIVIMGSKTAIPFFRRILGSQNDGIVSAERGRINGLRSFTVIDADHTFIQIHPEAIRQTLGFLKTGAVA